jgi:hypothetical protein
MKKIEYDKRRFSNPSSKLNSASKSPMQVTKQRPDSREWNFSTLVSQKSEIREAYSMQNSRTLLHQRRLKSSLGSRARQQTGTFTSSNVIIPITFNGELVRQTSPNEDRSFAQLPSNLSIE